MRAIRFFLLMLGMTWLGCAWLTPLPARATDAMTDFYAVAGADAVAWPEEAGEWLGDAPFSTEQPTTLLQLTPQKLLTGIWATLKAEALAPFVLFGALVVLTLLSAALGGMGDAVAAEKGLTRLFGTLCVLLCAGTAARPLGTCLARVAETLQEGSVFMLSFIPVFSAFLAAGGSIAAGATYQVFLLFITEWMLQLNTHLLLPLLQMGTAVGLVDAVNPTLRMGGLVTGFQTVVKWALGFLMALFAALLSVRSFVSAAADGLGAKTAKLLSSSLIPIVGGAVSDAFATVQGSIGLLRNGMGAAGIFVLAWMTLPPLLSVLLYRAVFAGASVFAELTGVKSLCQLFRNAQTILATAFAMLICFAMLLIFSTAILLLLLGVSA